MADPHDLDDGLPILDSPQDAVDANARAPAAICALKLICAGKEEVVFILVMIVLNPGQDDEPLFFRDFEKLFGRRFGPFDTEAHSASIAIDMTSIIE